MEMLAEVMNLDTSFAKAKVAGSEKSLEQLNASKRQLEAKLNNKSFRGPAQGLSVELLNAKLDASQARASADNLLNDFEILRTKLAGNENAIQALQARYENTNLNAFINEKFKLFVDSKLICNRFKHCESDQWAGFDRSSISKELNVTKPEVKGLQQEPKTAQ